MVNSYSMNTYPQMNYNQGFNQNIQPQQNRSSGFGSVVGTAVVGGAVGGTIGYLKNRHPVDKTALHQTRLQNKHLKITTARICPVMVKNFLNN